jgi:hypothetical protein
MFTLEIAACIISGTIHKYYLLIISTLPAPLKAFTGQKAQFTAIAPYPGRCVCYTKISYAINGDISLTFNLNKIARSFRIWQILSSYVDYYIKGGSIKG